MLISDTHICRHGSSFNLHAFNKGMEMINKIQNVSLYLHLGDITQNGTLLDYEHALIQMKKFDPISKAPIKYIIGNHDAENVGYLLFEEILGDRHFTYEDDSLYMLAVDSTKPDLASGIIHHNTINSLKLKLKEVDKQEKFKIVCFHHQTIPIPKTGKERSAIDDSGNMIQMLLESESDLVLNGHRHISNLYNISSPQKDLFLFNAGTFSCNKTRYRELFTYSVIDIDGNKITFRIFPIKESYHMREINREINHFYPREIKKNEEIYCKILQLSNSLISKKHADKETNFDKIINIINDIPDVDLVVHNGNLSKNSYEIEFKIAKEKLSKLKHPYLVVPGYTDSHPPAWEYWQKYIGPLDPSFKSKKLFFQGINSSTTDSNIGYIGRKKLRLLIENVLRTSHNKICGVACFHSLIPTPLSVWRTELTDAGDVLSQLANSDIDLILNSTPSISFGLKVENSLVSNGGSLQQNHFDKSFIEIDIYRDGLTTITENKLKTKEKKIIGKYNLNILDGIKY